MKIQKKLIRLTVFVAFLLAVSMVAFVIFAVYARYKVAERLDIGYGVSTDNEIVQLEIGDKVFRIPKNHIWSREDWRGGKVEAVNLQALLPDFEPYLDSTKSEFDKPGWNKKITLVLENHNMVGSKTGSQSMTRQAVYDRVVYDFSLQRKAKVTDFPGPYGLVLQTLDSSSSNSGRELYIGHKKDGGFYWVKCDMDRPNRYPSCNTYLEYSSQVYISYTFSKKYLNEWERIDAAVLSFIKNFDRKL
jgi:hypothetical protein